MINNRVLWILFKINEWRDNVIFEYKKKACKELNIWDITGRFFNLYIYPISDSTSIFHKEIMMGKFNDLKVQKYYRFMKKTLEV